jgi:hypothetical protein
MTLTHGVMAGLVTAKSVYQTCGAQSRATRASCVAIHVFATSTKEEVDARPKVGHDGR